ncbi:TPA: hypothetical protein QDB15_000130 [Burkholderia vietnamiensis]|uniref:Uncharacterized protein n=2 Tax=Burkholderiaceae TaxID=119060 RepID=A0A5E5P1U7_9BURK|nr:MULTISPECIES: hypothetical protein [Burkholderiaceae]AOZ05794.1 hypothetical protein BKK80_08215 [Cupriavidus malaysiensis]MCA8206404.1 hypothetical protein [Burkholderia vietnamiensis]VVG70324.1 hypothetical protein PAP18089_01284 [Pandoraea apista]HDR8943202.1 hypothetical protein [Burkholderia vietnamiensis]HDR9116406.1 hypothetical protein [Burkholderia vietnamiensis]
MSMWTAKQEEALATIVASLVAEKVEEPAVVDGLDAVYPALTVTVGVTLNGRHHTIQATEQPGEGWWAMFARHGRLDALQTSIDTGPAWEALKQQIGDDVFGGELMAFEDIFFAQDVRNAIEALASEAAFEHHQRHHVARVHSVKQEMDAARWQ